MRPGSNRVLSDGALSRPPAGTKAAHRSQAAPPPETLPQRFEFFASGSTTQKNSNPFSALFRQRFIQQHQGIKTRSRMNRFLRPLRSSTSVPSLDKEPTSSRQSSSCRLARSSKLTHGRGSAGARPQSVLLTAGTGKSRWPAAGEAPFSSPAPMFHRYISDLVAVL